MEYGIGVQNRYALFLDEGDDAASGDPYALLNAAQDGQQKSLAQGGLAGGKAVGQKTQAPLNPTAAAAKQQQFNNKNQGTTLSESKANVNANQKDGRRDNRDNRSRTGPQPQRPRDGQENRTQRSPRQFERSPRNFEGNAEGGDLKEGGGFRDGKDRRNGFGGRGGGQGGPRRGGFGAGGGQGGQRFDRKRDFNRHSGSDKTGVKPTDKRDGAGAHNWGKPEDFAAAPEDELVNGEQPPTEGGAAPAEGAEGTEGAPAGEGEKTEDGEPKSDEPVVKTLDEYKREREEKRLHAQFNTRKANEGEDKTKWKKTYVLKKKPIPDEEEVEYEEIEVEEDPSKRRGRQILDIEVNFRPSDEGRDFVRRGPRGGPGGRGRGGPGGPRGGGDREGGDRRPPRDGPQGAGGAPAGGDAPPRAPRGDGAPRGGNGPRGGGRGGRQGGRFQATPKFDDLNDFPSL